MDPRGKGVLLTGGAQGLGRGIVEELLSLGAKVLFCDVDVERGRATESELQTQYGADVVFFQPADVSDDEQHKAAFRAAVSQFGTVELCVNNAGLSTRKTGRKCWLSTWGSLLALEHMRRDRGGRGGVIINVASRAGINIYSFLPIYCASKHALVGFTTSCAMGPDQRDHGVRWCCLCPDAIRTSLASNKGLTYHPELAKQYVEKHGSMPVSQVVQAVMKLIRDPDNNGAILEVSHEKGARYRRRQVVDRDDVSDVEVVDTY